MVWLWMLLACKDGKINGNNPPGGSNNISIPGTTPDEQFDGDLSDGETIDLSWADNADIACWPGTEDANFRGSHVFFSIDKEDAPSMVIQAIPEDDIDISLYTLEFAAGGASTPPNVSGVTRCESSYDQESNSNPGAPEAIELSGFPEGDLLLGVAGAAGENDGGFTVNIWREF